MFKLIDLELKFIRENLELISKLMLAEIKLSY